MKHLIIAALAMGLLNSAVWAGQVDTECPWMKEETTRHNPKANMGSGQQGIKVKPKVIRQ